MKRINESQTPDPMPDSVDAPVDNLFPMLDDAVICLIMEMIAIGNAPSDAHRTRYLLRLAATCKRMRAVAMCKTARQFVWPLLDPTESFGDGDGPADIATVLDGAVFGSARRINHGCIPFETFNRLVTINSETLESLTVNMPTRSIPTQLLDALDAAFALPRLRRLEVNRAFVNGDGTDRSVDVSETTVEELVINVGSSASDITFRGKFPHLRKLTIGESMNPQIVSAIEASPMLEELRLSPRSSHPETVYDTICAHLPSLRRLHLNIHPSPDHVEVLRGFLSRHPGTLDTLRIASPPHGELRYVQDLGLRETLARPGAALAKNLTDLSVTGLVFGSPDIDALSCCLNLRALALGPVGYPYVPKVDERLRLKSLQSTFDRFGHQPGACSLVKLWINASYYLDISNFLATPRCAGLADLSLMIYRMPLEICDQLANSLRSFSGSSSHPKYVLFPVLQHCRNLETLNFMTESLDVEAPADWDSHRAWPIRVSLSAGSVSTWLIKTMSNRMRTLSITLRGPLKRPDDALESAEDFAMCCKTLEKIKIATSAGACCGQTTISSHGSHPIITILN